MILSKNVIIENIKREINDNTTGQITPFDISHNLIDIVDSIHVLTAGKNIDSNNDKASTATTRSFRWEICMHALSFTERVYSCSCYNPMP